MRVPAFVLDPRSAEEAYIPIEEVEPGSILAMAVIRKEREQADDFFGLDDKFRKWRLRAIARYLQVPVTRGKGVQ